jgi:PEP-CTERM motif
MRLRELTFTASLAGLALLFAGFGQARADFMVTSPAQLYSYEAGQADQTIFASDYDPTGAYHSYNFDSGTGFTATAAASISASYSVSATQFSLTFGEQGSVVASSTDPGTYHNDYFASAIANLQNLSVSIDQASMATITFNPTMNLGTANITPLSTSPAADETIETYLEIYGNSFPTDVEGYAHYFVWPAYQVPPVNTITNVSGNGPGTPGDSITVMLPVGTYSISGYMEDIISFDNGGTGSFTDPFTSGTGTITINAITPEPSSMALLSIGAISLFGVARSKRGTRAK